MAHFLIDIVSPGSSGKQFGEHFLKFFLELVILEFAVEEPLYDILLSLFRLLLLPLVSLHFAVNVQQGGYLCAQAAIHFRHF